VKFRGKAGGGNEYPCCGAGGGGGGAPGGGLLAAGSVFFGTGGENHKTNHPGKEKVAGGDKKNIKKGDGVSARGPRNGFGDQVKKKTPPKPLF